MGAEHDTEVRAANGAVAGWTLGTIVQLVPSQCSTNDFAPGDRVFSELAVVPTAVQSVGLVQVTPINSKNAAVGLGLLTIDHVLPFQRSTSVFAAVSVSSMPTAKQLVAVGHDTPARSTMSAADVLAGGTIDHFVPFQCSINAVSASSPSTEPTAKQLVAARRTTRR